MVLAVTALAGTAWWGIRNAQADPPPSTCLGTPARGALRNGVKLPASGVNYDAYSDVGRTLGRTYVHNRVREVVVDAYRALHTTHPDHKFVYGETGWLDGGSFKPHRTHQNGLSVDFMVPVLSSEGAPTRLPTSALNKWGYGLEFDRRGQGEGLRIDFEAMAAHLAALRAQARAHGVGIAKVIFAPELRARLKRTRAWKSIRRLPFSKKPVWVRHDDHYHVDFKLACEPLK